MATEGGTDLREVIAVALYDAQWEGAGFSYAGEVEQAFARQCADAILGAIAEAGMVIVDAERLEALIHDARMWGERCQLHGGGPVKAHRQGDLDGPGGGEG